MVKRFSFAILIAAIVAVAVPAAADICDVRPDLCGGKALPKKKKSAKKRKETVGDYRAKEKPQCRKRGEPFSLGAADLPICGSETSTAAIEAEDDLFDGNEVKKSKPRKRSPARRTNDTAGMNFDSYMQNNSAHPAITRRPSSVNQTAFPEPVRRPATITGSTLDQEATPPAGPASGSTSKEIPVPSTGEAPPAAPNQ